MVTRHLKNRYQQLELGDEPKNCPFNRHEDEGALHTELSFKRHSHSEKT